MKVIIVGGGRVGYYLVKTLLENGYETIVIENDKKACQMFANDLDIPIIYGDGTMIEALEAAEAADCDALVAVTGMDENNLIACQLAKKMFNVKKTVAKVNNPKNEAALKQLGVDIVVSATGNITNILEREIDNDSLKQNIRVKGGKFTVYEVLLPEDYILHGTMIKDLVFPEDCNIIAVTHDDEISAARGKTVISSGDTLMIFALESVWNDIRKVLKLKQ